MTIAQLQFVMDGKTIDDVILFATSQSGRIYREKYDQVSIDYDNELIKLEINYGETEYYVISEIIGLMFKAT